jgi:hypothetical protein
MNEKSTTHNEFDHSKKLRAIHNFNILNLKGIFECVFLFIFSKISDLRTQQNQTKIEI